MIRSIATAALIALTITAAQADEATVRFGGLNLTSPTDTEILKSRVAEAAIKACGPVQLDFGVRASTIYEAGQEQKACIARASARTLARIQAMAGGRRPSTLRLAGQ